MKPPNVCVCTSCCMRFLSHSSEIHFISFKIITIKCRAAIKFQFLRYFEWITSRYCTSMLVYVRVWASVRNLKIFSRFFFAFVDTTVTCIIFLLTAIQMHQIQCDASNEWNWAEFYTRSSKNASYRIFLDGIRKRNTLKLIIKFPHIEFYMLAYAFQISNIYLQTMVNLCLKIW